MITAGLLAAVTVTSPMVICKSKPFPIPLAAVHVTSVLAMVTEHALAVYLVISSEGPYVTSTYKKN